jgi:hypothetical protein
MKRILLTSTALVAFAGAAAAEVSWSGSATLGYNDDINDGVYADTDIDVTLSQELDNGVTASVTFGWELEQHENNDDNGEFNADNNVSVSLTSDAASVFYGDTAYAAETYWSGVTNMGQDSFSEADGENVLRGEMTFGSVTAGISYGVGNSGDTDNGELNQLSLGVTASLGAADVIFAYQEEDITPSNGQDDNDDFNANQVLGLAVSGSLVGADITFAYAKNDAETSTGIEVAYPFGGGVTATVFYVSESASDDNYGLQIDYASGPVTVSAFYHDGNDEDAGINVSYDVGNGLNIYAGGSDDDGQYIGAEYDLGGGASLTASFADDAGNDEIGPQEYLDGTTVAVSFSF